jgi:hypothetical protein
LLSALAAEPGASEIAPRRRRLRRIFLSSYDIVYDINRCGVAAQAPRGSKK